MKNKPQKLAKPTPRLFDRVATILEEARASVVRTVNSRMVVAYWLIGREIVQEEQGGKKRADYGNALIEDLSRRLTERYGRGYSPSNLADCRRFHQVYADRLPEIRHTACGELALGKPRPLTEKIFHEPRGKSPANDAIRHESRGELPTAQGFSPDLSWTHYRRLMRVENVHLLKLLRRDWDMVVREQQSPYGKARPLAQRNPEGEAP